MKSKQQLILGRLTLIFMTGLIAFFIVTSQDKYEQQTTAAGENLNQIVEQPKPVPVETIKGADAFGKYVQAGEYALKDYTESFIDEPIKVEWKKEHPQLSPREVAALLTKIYPNYTSAEHCKNVPDIQVDYEFCSSRIALAGIITAPVRFKDQKLYYLEIPIYDEGIGSPPLTYLALFSKELNRFIFIQQDQQEVKKFEGASKLFAGYIFQKFPELDYPRSLTITNDSSTLEIFGGGLTFDGIKDRQNGSALFVHPTYGPVTYNQDDHMYHIILPDGTDVYYYFLPYFLKKQTPAGAEKELYSSSYDALIDWTDARTEKPDEQYLPSINVRAGCGGRMLPNSDRTNAELWFDESNLKPVGSTNHGEIIYEFSKTSLGDIYDQLYNIGYAGSLTADGNEYAVDGKKYTYDEFVQLPKEILFTKFMSEHPLFFWKDKYGNWRAFQKAKYQSIVECGKPVIYLYPEKEQDVQVQVAPNGGFTKTEPVYGANGWQVSATPEGQIYNYADKTVYPYLFWEGHAYGAETPKQGFVFVKNDVPSGMRALLYKTGLTSKETEDFMEFWQEKLMVKPYVFVTFLPQREFDAMAPLRVAPRPETVIRVFMDYTPLDEPMSVEPLPITTRVRRGFTVVEWGGAIKQNRS